MGTKEAALGRLREDEYPQEGNKKRCTGRKAMDHAISPYEPAIEEIRARAYEVYVQRGRVDGFDLEDWLRAEEELKATLQ